MQRKVLNAIEIVEGMGGFHDSVHSLFIFLFGAYALAGFKLEILQRAYKKRKNDKLTLNQEHFSNRKNMKVGEFCSQKQLEEYLSAEPVMKSLRLKLR